MSTNMDIYCKRLADYIIAKTSHDKNETINILLLREIAGNVILPSGETVKNYAEKIRKSIHVSLIWESYFSQLCDKAYCDTKDLNSTHKEAVLTVLEVPTDEKELGVIRAEASLAVHDAYRAMYEEDVEHQEEYV